MSGSKCSSPSATVHILTGLLTLSYPSASWSFNQSWSERIKVSCSACVAEHMQYSPSCLFHLFLMLDQTRAPSQCLHLKARGAHPGLGRYAVISFSRHITFFLGSDSTPWPREVKVAGFASPWSSARCFRIDLGLTPSRAPLSGSLLILPWFGAAANNCFCWVLSAPLSLDAAA